jgi:outer membrane lipoprotein-sorting protein
MMKKIFILFFALTFVLNAQNNNADKILSEVKKKFEKVNDYKCDVNIKVDFDFIKMPDTKATIYFKKPNKVKMESKGFAMLPKQGINFSPMQLLEGDFNTLYIRQEKYGNYATDVVKIIPNSDSSDIIMTTLWVDNAQSLIRKIETIGRKAGTIKIELNYSAGQTHPMPESAKFYFNFGEMSMPMNPMQQDKKDDENRGRVPQEMKGAVTITYSDYEVNKGLPDSLFKDEPKKEDKKKK